VLKYSPTLRTVGTNRGISDARARVTGFFSTL